MPTDLTLRLGLAALLLLSPSGLRAQTEVPLDAGAWLVAPVVTGSGDTLHFIVDTGATHSVVSTTAALEHTVGPVTSVVVQGMSGRLLARRTRFPELRLGDRVLTDVPVVVLPDSLLRSGGRDLDGVLGADMLAPYDVLLDAPGGRMVLLANGAAPGAADEARLGEAMPVLVRGGGIVTHEVLLGGRAGRAILDTGAQYLVTNAAGAATGTEAGSPGEEELLSPGIGTRRITMTRTSIDLSVGATSLGWVSSRVGELPVFGALGLTDEPAVVVGTPVIRGCAILLSYRSRTIRYCRTPTQ